MSTVKMNGETQMDAAAVARKITPQAADPNGMPNLDSIRADLKFFQDEGEVANKTMKVEDCIDLFFAEAAAKELGPFTRKN